MMRGVGRQTTPTQPGEKTGMHEQVNGTPKARPTQHLSKLGSRAISGREGETPPSGRNANFKPAIDTTYHSIVTIHANSVVVKKIKHQTDQPPPRSSRGVITRFTARSRSRMMRKTGMLRGLKNPYFVTLTYPGHFEHSPDRVKEHLHALKKRIKRRFPNMAMVWRMELKTRQTGLSAGEIVPHFHMLLWGMSVLETDMLKAMKQLWFEVALSFKDHPPVIMPTLDDKGTPDLEAMTTEQRNFYEHGVDVEQLFNFRHTLSYVSKYAAKEEDDETAQHWGRRWGVCGRVDLSPSYTVKLTTKEHYALRRAIRKALEKRGSKYAWWLKTAYPDYGFAALGFGDDDDLPTAVLTDIVRLVAHTKGWEIELHIIDTRHKR